MHSMERNTACAACGDLDGCHLWQIDGVPVRWNKEGFARINEMFELRVYTNGIWHIYVKGVSRANGECKDAKRAKETVVLAAKLVMQLVKLEAQE